MSEAFAINEIGRGGILVDTVHRTRRAAIVNWLVTRKDIMVTAAWTDDMIEQMWRSMRDDRTYCIKVEISAVQSADANVTEPSP